MPHKEGMLMHLQSSSAPCSAPKLICLGLQLIKLIGLFHKQWLQAKELCSILPMLPSNICTAHPVLPPAQVLLLDELTTFLDTADQQNVLQAVRNVVDTASAPVTALWVCTCHASHCVCIDWSSIVQPQLERVITVKAV